MKYACISQARKDALNKLQLFFEIDQDRREATYKVGSVTMSWYQFRTGYVIKLTVGLEEEVDHELVGPIFLRLVKYDPYSEVDTIVPASGAIAFIADSPGQYGFHLL